MTESEKYRLEATLQPYRDMDWKTLMAINPQAGDTKLNIALAFRELAENAKNINNLNISPNLLDSLIDESEEQQQM